MRTDLAYKGVWISPRGAKQLGALNSTFNYESQKFKSYYHCAWVTCVDPTGIQDCAIEWATESNAFTCSYVYLNYKHVDLGGTFNFLGAIPIVETQVAKGIIPRFPS